MPDGDVFARKVRRNWQTASSRMIGGGEGYQALPAVFRALAKEIKANGCPGLDQIVDILVSVFRLQQPTTERIQAVAQLDQVRVQHGNRSTEIAIGSSRRLLAGNSESEPALQEMDDGELRIHLSAIILADLADASLCPAALLSELVEEKDVSFQEVHSRRAQCKELLIAAPETRRTAVQLLVDPSGASVRAPQIRREPLSQAEILATALTR